MTYKIWNKKDEVKGFSAEFIIERNKIKEDDEVFLILDELGVVRQIQVVSTIKSNYGFDPNLSAKETAQAYLDLKAKEEETVIKEQITLEDQSKKIDILEAENNRLREVEKEQDKMIMDNAYKMTILESNMGGM